MVVAAALGIKNCHEECFDILQDVVRNMIQTIGTRAKTNAEITERSCPGIQDVISSLESVVSTLFNFPF